MPTSPTSIDSLHLQPVILVARPAAGGIRSHLISLLTHLDRSKFSLTLSAPKSLLDSVPDDLPAYEKFELPIASKTTPLDLLAALKLVQLIKSHPNAIVHAHGVRAGFVCSLARQIRSFCLVVTHHNIPPQGSLSNFVLELIDFGCAATIAVSNAIAERLPGTDTTVIPNGIDVSRYGNLSKAEARSTLEISDSEFVVATLGRLSREKGVDLAIRAAIMLPEIKFLIAGDGPQKQRLMRSSPANVRFLGRISYPAILFSAADIALIPSRTEGQGIAALEAMACGCPAIAAQVGGLVETIEDSGGGILVEPESPVDIVTTIIELQDNPKLLDNLAEKGKAWVDSHGVAADRMRDMQEVYSQVAQHNIPLK